MKFAYEPGQTPIDPNESQGLIPNIELQSQLNDEEAVNIAVARSWLETARGVDPLSTAFLRKLHQRMLDHVWKWAGIYRQSEKNIGGSWTTVPERMENLVRDVATQIEKKAYPPDEIAVRYHHRLTFIHPFPNGNGRHARLATDLLVARTLKLRPFTWGFASGAPVAEVRAKYIDALKKADAGDYGTLKAFVRS